MWGGCPQLLGQASMAAEAGRCALQHLAHWGRHYASYIHAAPPSPARPNRSGLFLVIIIAIYTAGTAARLTAAQLAGSIRSREDLKGRAVGTCALARPGAARRSQPSQTGLADWL